MGTDPLWLEKPFDRWRARWDLIQSAAYRQRSRLAGNQLLTEERGEVLTSIRYLAERWGWTEKRVRSFLAMLSKMGTIRAQRRTSLGQVYSIENYDAYQFPGQAETESGAQVGHSTGTGGAQAGHVSGTAEAGAGQGSGAETMVAAGRPRRGETVLEGTPLSPLAHPSGRSAEIVPIITRLWPSAGSASEAPECSLEAPERRSGTGAGEGVSGLLRPAWWRVAVSRSGRCRSSPSGRLSASTVSLSDRSGTLDVTGGSQPGSGTVGAQLGHRQGTAGARDRAQRIEVREEREEGKLAAASRVRARRRRSMEFECSAMEFLGRRLSSGELELLATWERRYGPCVLRFGFERAQERRLCADPGWSPPLSYLTPILRELLDRYLKDHPELSEDVEEERGAALADLAELELPEEDRERFRREMEGAQDGEEVADLLEEALELASRPAEKGVAHG